MGRKRVAEVAAERPRQPYQGDIPETAMVPLAQMIASWMPIHAQTTAREKLLTGLSRIEAEIESKPTAPMFEVRLKYIEAIIKEAEKGGGALGDRMRSYADEVSRKREVTRTVTMKEVVTEIDDPETTIEGECREALEVAR